MLNSSVEHLVSLYSEEPSAGSPYNTGDGVLTTGLADKVSFQFVALYFCIAPNSYISAYSARARSVETFQ